MKNMNALHILLAISFLAGTACSPKNQQARQNHEAKREWTPTRTSDDPSVDADSVGTFNLTKAYKDLSNTESAALMKNILVPLSSFVLNQRIVETPRHRTTRLSQMVHIFHQALLIGLDRGDKSAAFQAIKDKYFATVFSGCSGDLRNDCINVEVFSNDARFTRIMTRLAQEKDAVIERELLAHKKSNEACIKESADCRKAIEDRYRLLAMGNVKKNRNDDGTFNFAYLKYARLFATLLDYDKANGVANPGYIAEVHGKIFETVIARYNPKSMDDKEFKTFVENFNPWGYSQKQADTFQYGTKIMFKYGTECCLYEDRAKTKLSDAVKKAIASSQAESDTMGVPFHQMVTEIRQKFQDRLFLNLGIAGEAAGLENMNSSFYDEYFLVVDRLFRGHLNSSEVEMVLRNAPSEKTQKVLPEKIALYIKIYLIHMVLQTNEHMSGIYTSNIASDKVFEEATTRSRELTARWHVIQTQIDLLERVMGSYFKGQNLFSQSYVQATRLIKSVNRNIHYISVYPNMIVMNYFLAKMKGKIVVNTWWGRIEINADTILDAFFDGLVTDPWFRFGKDPESLDRQMLLYGWDYMLSTGSLAGVEREKFFETIFTKYVDDNLYDLRKRVTSLERETFGNSNFANVGALCDYEMDNKRFPPAIKINFLELNRYTYGGLGENGANNLMNKLLSEPALAVAYYREAVDTRLVYIRSMVDLVEQNLRRANATEEEIKRDTATGRRLLEEFEQLKLQLARIFVPQHKRLFECALRLQEIERRRANRLYDEERAHLGMVFDLIKPLVSIKDKDARDARIKEINETVFRGQNSNYRFDMVSGLTYRMSRFDLLMRVKKNIESDIFVNLNEEERRLYGDSNAEYARPRSVSVFTPEGLARHEMVTQEIANTIYVNGDSEADRAAFIRDGMAAFNGKTGSFVDWQSQRAGDRGLTYYLNSLKEFYLLGPVYEADGKTKYEVTAKDLTDAFVKVYASYTLDPVDIKNSLELKNDGRFERAVFANLLWEDNGSRLPFFYELMVTTKGRAGTNVEGRIEGSTAAMDAFNFAQTMINLRTFVFQPSPAIEAAVKANYGERANSAFRRVQELYDHLVKVEQQFGDVAKIDPRLSMPFLLQDGRPLLWYSQNAPMVDAQKRNDHRILIEDFARRTGNFFKTTESVKVQ